MNLMAGIFGFSRNEHFKDLHHTMLWIYYNLVTACEMKHW